MNSKNPIHLMYAYRTLCGVHIPSEPDITITHDPQHATCWACRDVHAIIDRSNVAPSDADRAEDMVNALSQCMWHAGNMSDPRGAEFALSLHEHFERAQTIARSAGAWGQRGKA